MTKKLSIVTDFDGVITDEEAEAVGFIDAYITKLSRKLRIPTQTVRKRLDAIKLGIVSHPREAPKWEFAGWEVAPIAGPYILHSVAASILVKELAKESSSVRQKLKGVDTGKMFENLHYESYQYSGTVFAPYAKHFLKDLSAFGKLTIVTNSKTTAVQKKLGQLLGENSGIKIVGGADKHKIVSDWKGLPEKVKLPGFPKPVYLRRKMYHDALAAIGHVDVVIGDTYELDLALPEAEGIKTVLVTNKLPVLDWERDYYAKYQKNGFAAKSLEKISERLLSE